MPPPVPAHVIGRRLAVTARPQDSFQGACLTPTEVEVARGIASGMTCKEIAQAWGISFKTTGTHRDRAIKKTGSRNNSDLTRWCILHGLVQIDGAAPGSQIENRHETVRVLRAETIRALSVDEPGTAAQDEEHW